MKKKKIDEKLLELEQLEERARRKTNSPLTSPIITLLLGFLPMIISMIAWAMYHNDQKFPGTPYGLLLVSGGIGVYLVRKYSTWMSNLYLKHMETKKALDNYFRAKNHALIMKKITQALIPGKYLSKRKIVAVKYYVDILPLVSQRA